MIKIIKFAYKKDPLIKVGHYLEYDNYLANQLNVYLTLTHRYIKT